MAGRVMLAAPKSGSGKTLLTCALLEVMKKRIGKLSACKCGPDFIDPMFHRKVQGVESRNLDSFFLPGEELKSYFEEYSRNTELVIMEAVMGLYDGLGGISETASGYEIASLTETPIILAVDAHGMGRSVLPLLRGFLSYDKCALIRGVILNRISRGFYESIRPVFERELPEIRLLGYFPEKKELQIESRHLGLKIPEELSEIREKLREAGRLFEETVDIEEIIRISYGKEAPSQEIFKTEQEKHIAKEKKIEEKRDNASVLPHSLRLAVARDEAFCFYYEENLELFRTMGVELVEFSPLHEEKLPENIQGILLGGGYPELYLKKLSENISMKREISGKIKAGLPSLAECGGFMYLHSEISDKEGKAYPMLSVLPGRVSYQGKLVRFGYMKLRERIPGFLPEGERIRGHEFHYYDSSENGADCIAEKPLSGKSWDCVFSGENHFWGFPHLYYPSNPHFVRSFVRKMREYQRTHEQLISLE